jgi:hypothetical protein
MSRFTVATPCRLDVVLDVIPVLPRSLMGCSAWALVGGS